MWVTKLQVKHADCPIVTRCQEFLLPVLSYPGSWHESKGNRFATTTCFFQSNDSNAKKRFLNSLQKDSRIKQLEISGDIFTYEINLGKTGRHVMLYHSKDIFFVKPVINNSDGFEYWEIAAWKKLSLERFIKNLRENMDFVKICKLTQSPLQNIYFPNVLPSLSPAQRNAIYLAYQQGYYSYPRSITLRELARLSKISLSTFQEHLRKAEARLLPSIIGHSADPK